MQFTKIGEYLSASRITGPRHNLLMVKVSSGLQEAVTCECMPAIGKCVHEPLDESELVKSVLNGVADANATYKSNYCITHIKYVANDTKPEKVYGIMAFRIIEKIESDGEFDVGISP